jgi:photosystem II stability/assembly factor-like uncharacterized protein
MIINAKAQWYEVYATETGLSEIYFKDTEWGLVAGNNAIFITEDLGSTWNIYNEFDTIFLPTSIFIVSDTVAYISSMVPPGTFKTVDKGLDWIYIPLTLDGNYFTEIYLINPDTGYAVGSYGFFYKTFDGFQTNYFQNFTPYELDDVFFLSIDTGFVCSQNNEIQQTTDGGESWIPILYSPPSSELMFVSYKTGFAIGNGNLYKTIDSGQIWAEMPKSESVGYYHIYYMWFLNDSTGYITAFTEDNVAVILKTVDGGTSWIKNEIPADTYIMGPVSCINNDTCFALSQSLSLPYYRILKTTNGGGIDTTTTIINTADAINFSLHPNPANTFITISSLRNIESIKTFDYLGKQVSVIFNANLQADITHLPAGIYFTEVITDKGKGVQKWVKM